MSDTTTNSETKTETIRELVEKNGKGKGCLVGVDGNAFSLMGYTQKALRRAGWKRSDIEIVIDAAMSGDYNNLIRVLDSTLEDGEEVWEEDSLDE